MTGEGNILLKNILSPRKQFNTGRYFYIGKKSLCVLMDNSTWWCEKLFCSSSWKYLFLTCILPHTHKHIIHIHIYSWYTVCIAIYNWYLLYDEVYDAQDHEKCDAGSPKRCAENCASWSSRWRGLGRYLRVPGTGSTWVRRLSISLLLRTISNGLFVAVLFWCVSRIN